jgi:hypothetical protein
MRAVTQAAIKAKEVTRGTFDFAGTIASPSDTVYVGLVGGTDPASIAVRRAQSMLRFDRRPSYFSHIFLFTGRGDSMLECRVVGADPTRPETGGIIRDRARRYTDAEAWPNKAVVGFTFTPVPGGTEPGERVKQVLTAARNVKLVRERYDLWSIVGSWQPYLFEPAKIPNPLVEGSPHPGAAFVRWALSMAGVEGTPSALDEYDAPEHFWAASKYWYKQYADPSVAVKISVVRQIGDKAGCVRVLD